MQANRPLDRWLNLVMSFLLPLAGVWVVLPLLLRSNLPTWASWIIGIPAGVSAGWVVSLLACSMLTILTRRL